MYILHGELNNVANGIILVQNWKKAKKTIRKNQNKEEKKPKKSCEHLKYNTQPAF